MIRKKENAKVLGKERQPGESSCKYTEAVEYL